MGRHANPDIRRAFAEFQDSNTPSKCLKVRCLHCGYIRAKNTTRQIEHLQECKAYLNSADALSHLTESAEPTPTRTSSLSGTHPNPNLQINRRGPHKRTRDGMIIHHHPGVQAAPTPIAPGPVQPQPSLTMHLFGRAGTIFRAAAERPFLAQAGAGTVSEAMVCQWLDQLGHFNRAYIQMIGQLISKVKLPTTVNAQTSLPFRALDLLISSLNNIRREVQYLDLTMSKFGIVPTSDPIRPTTRAIVDLMAGATSHNASLLEGMVVLWALTHYCRAAWRYAGRYLPVPGSSTNAMMAPHVAALHQNLIPNWMSADYSKYVDNCAILVDDLANAMTAPGGKEEMNRCEDALRQVCWAMHNFWPDTIGPVANGMSPSAMAGNDVTIGTADGRAVDTPHSSHTIGNSGSQPTHTHADGLGQGVDSSLVGGDHGAGNSVLGATMNVSSLVGAGGAGLMATSQPATSTAAAVAAAVAAAGLQTPIPAQTLAQFAAHQPMGPHMSPLGPAGHFMPQMMVRPASLQVAQQQPQQQQQQQQHGGRKDVKTIANGTGDPSATPTSVSSVTVPTRPESTPNLGSMHGRGHVGASSTPTMQAPQVGMHTPMQTQAHLQRHSVQPDGPSQPFSPQIRPTATMLHHSPPIGPVGSQLAGGGDHGATPPQTSATLGMGGPAGLMVGPGGGINVNVGPMGGKQDTMVNPASLAAAAAAVAAVVPSSMDHTGTGLH